MQGFGNTHVKKPTTSAAADTPIETPTATFPPSLNPDPVLLPPLPPAVVVGKELGVPEIVFAVVAEGNWALDEGCLVVVKERVVSGAVYAVAVEEGVVSEIADRVILEKEKVLGTTDRVVVV